MPDIIDDKSRICIPFILDCIEAHKSQYADGAVSPFFLGLNGIQGAGKTTLVSSLHKALTSPPYNFPTAVLSIDDLYLPHEAQVELARTQPNNPLIQHRGQPSTHDLKLGLSLFQALKERNSNVPIPSYNKAAYEGEGDRQPEDEWNSVNVEGSKPIEVVIFEGWCVGFRALENEDLFRRWRLAKAREDNGEGTGILGRIRLQDAEFVNAALRGYDVLTNFLHALIHIDAEDTKFVYRWRQEQEQALRVEKGCGMTDDQVVEFVDGYYPAYELYIDGLRRGLFPMKKGNQLRIIIGRDRKVKEAQTL